MQIRFFQIVCVFLLVFAAVSCRRAEPVGAAAEPDVLVGTTGRIRGFDPARASDVASSLAVGRVYEGLYQYDYHARPYKLIPLLAGDMPDVSGDGLTYTIRLKPDVFFQDDPCFVETGGKGRNVTARDVIYSILRVADQKVGSGGYWAFRGQIAGLDEFRALSGLPVPTDYDLDVEGLEELDSHTLRIHLLKPYPRLLWVLAMPYAYVVPREAVEFYADDFVNRPVGTGPFMLKTWQRNYRFEYVRNPAWKPRHAAEQEAFSSGVPPGQKVGEMPQIKRIILYVMDDAGTRWLAFLSGQTDLYTDISHDNWDAIFTDDRQLHADLAGQGIQLRSIAGLNVYYIGFNMDDPVVGQNKKLRQAISCAFNSDVWMAYYRRRVMRATGPIPPGVAGYAGDSTPYPFDLERARHLLAEAGYPEGIDPATGRRLVLTLELGRTDAEFRESSELIADFMSQIGITLELSFNNRPAFFEKVERRNAQLFRLSWFADYPDGQNFLQLFYGPNASPGPNRANYSNPDYDRLYEKAQIMQDSPERTALYERMARVIMEDCPWLFTHYPIDYTLVHRRLHNHRPHDFPYGMEKYLIKTYD